MKQRVRHRPLPCKQRPTGSIMGYIHASEDATVMLSFSPFWADFAASGLLCLPGEELGQTAFVLLALLLLLLPLLLTL